MKGGWPVTSKEFDRLPQDDRQRLWQEAKNKAVKRTTA